MYRLEFVQPLAAGENFALEFWYHMFGVQMGTLSVEIADATAGTPTWTAVWSKIGQQQAAAADPWQHAVVAITPTANSLLRIYGLTGIDYHSDMCDKSSLVISGIA